MCKKVLLALAALVVAPIAAHAAVAFTPGNLIVVRSGNDDHPSANGDAVPGYLDEYDAAGGLVQSVPLGDYTDTVNQQFMLNGGNGNGGFISRSFDGRYFTLGGYSAVVGTGAVSSTASATNARLVARVDLDANIDKTTALNDMGSNEIRAATSFDGSQFWVTGTGSAQTTRYTTLGALTSTRIATSSSGFGPRAINIFRDAVGDPQLYVSRSSSSNPVNTLIRSTDPVPKLPVTGTATATPVYATSASSGYDFLFLDDSTLYVTDDDNSSVGGIQKWTRSGTVWTRQYVLQAGLSSVPLRGLTGRYDELGRPVLYATDGNGQNLLVLVDTGSDSSFITLATAPANTRFHDVVMVPEPATMALLAVGGFVFLPRRRKT